MMAYIYIPIYYYTMISNWKSQCNALRTDQIISRLRASYPHDAMIKPPVFQTSFWAFLKLAEFFTLICAHRSDLHSCDRISGARLHVSPFPSGSTFTLVTLPSSTIREYLHRKRNSRKEYNIYRCMLVGLRFNTNQSNSWICRFYSLICQCTWSQETTPSVQCYHFETKFWLAGWYEFVGWGGFVMVSFWALGVELCCKLHWGCGPCRQAG